MTTIANRNVLITGGASGIGRLMALRIARLGGTPILWDIDQQSLEQTVAEVQQQTGRPAHGYRCDVSDRHQVSEVARRVQQEVGPVDILINNAGIVSGRRLLDLPAEKIEATFGVNTLALFWTAKAFLPQMIARGSGHIVTVASAAGVIGVARLTDYSASKWAAVGFDESLRVELAATAPWVRTTVVCPYYINTGMFDGVRTRFPALLPILEEDQVAARIVSAIQHGRQRLILPPLVGLVPLARVLPTAVFDRLAGFLGINVSMEQFAGHTR
jgi:all-trans-retinol dehydrogenase (NAD+)